MPLLDEKIGPIDLNKIMQDRDRLLNRLILSIALAPPKLLLAKPKKPRPKSTFSSQT